MRHAIPCALVLLTAAPAWADEPGVGLEGVDEPHTITGDVTPAPVPRTPRARLELGFGYASLLEDPDVAEGHGGGLFFSYEMWGRLGAELTVFLSRNLYEDQLGTIGTSFLAGNITLGPTIRLTPAGRRVLVTADLALGTYLIVPIVQENIWTLGISGGLTLAYRFASWFGVSIKLRYHLFNLANFAGPELRDLKALMKVGVIDRMEIPLCMTFFF